MLETASRPSGVIEGLLYLWHCTVSATYMLFNSAANTTALRVGLTEDMQGCGAAALRRHAVPCGAVRCGAVRSGAALHLDWRARLRAVAAPSACCSASLRQESAAAELCGAVRCCAVDSFLVAVRCSGRCCAVPVLR